MEWKIGDLARINPDASIASRWAMNWREHNKTLRITRVEDLGESVWVEPLVKSGDPEMDRQRNPYPHLIEKL